MALAGNGKEERHGGNIGSGGVKISKPAAKSMIKESIGASGGRNHKAKWRDGIA